MQQRIRANAVPILAAALALWVVGRLALYGWALTDYDFEARPSLDALVGGHLQQFLQLAPTYGGSLIMRAPFVLATKLWHGGELSIYRAAATPCLLASGALGVWLVSRMRALGRGKLACGIALALCVANPLTLPALENGHPEELLGAVLCVAAVLAAGRDRPIWAGLLLGLAVANKEWAVVAAGPVAIALPRRRILSLLIGAGVAGAFMAPLLLASGSFASQVHGAATSAPVIFNPWQIWWFLGGHVHVLRDATGHVIPGHQWSHRVEPAWVGTISHPLIVGITLPLSLAYALVRGRRKGGQALDGLLLLMLFLLLRCMLDPWDYTYYPLPFLIALVAWEALAFERPPVLSLVASGAAWVVFEWALPFRGFSPDQQSLLFLACALPALIMIVRALYLPRLASPRALPGPERVARVAAA